MVEEKLTGYPGSLGPTMVAVLTNLIDNDVAPADVDPDRLERLMGRLDFIEGLGADVRLKRQPLRPGVPVTESIRDLLGERLRVMPGVGHRLVMVAPVEAVTIPGLGFTALLGPPIARAMDTDEAEAIHNAWAVIEEAFGWATEAVIPWQSAFERAVLRSNHDAALVARAMMDMPPQRRRSLWRELVAHLRDQEVDESHRPGPRGLDRRLGAARLRVGAQVLETLLPLARAAYAACRDNPDVEAGVCPCEASDLAMYQGWVDVPQAARLALRAMGPEAIEHHLRVLSAVEAGIIDAFYPTDVARALRGFRDSLLRRRYVKDAGSLLGVDPLSLAEAGLALGADRQAIVSAVQGIAKRAALEAERVAADSSREIHVRTPSNATRQTEAVEEVVTAPEISEEVPLNPVAEKAEEPMVTSDSDQEKEARISEEPSGEDGQDEDLESASRPVTDVPAPDALVTRKNPCEEPPDPAIPAPDTTVGNAPRRRPAPALSPRPAALPPMPSPPPPRNRPVTAPRPPMPDIASIPTMGSGPSENGGASRPARRARTAEGRELVTPAEGAIFYEVAFRRIQVLERDLLERGSWPAAVEQMNDYTQEAARLIQALGPPARSGDESFADALRKVEMVASYIDRVTPLLVPGSREPQEEVPDQQGVLSRLGRIFSGTKPG